jgi:hypothetical protein
MLVVVQVKFDRHRAIGKIATERSKAMPWVDIQVHTNGVHSKYMDGGWKVLQLAPVSCKVGGVMDIGLKMAGKRL